MDTNPVAEVAEVSPEDRIAAFFDDEAPQAEAPEASEADESEEPAEGEAEAVEEDQAETAPEPEVEEVELEGEQFKLPPKVAALVKKADSLDKDYTQKTQALADEKRVYEDKRMFIEAKEHLLGQSFKEAAELQSIQQQLEQYAALDWNTLIAEDPQQAMRLSFARQELQGKLSEKQQNLQRSSAQIDEARKKHEANQKALNRAELERRIGVIKQPDVDRLMSAAQELKYAETDMLSPAAMHALHLASKYLALQKAKPELTKKIASAKPMQAPAARSSNNSIEQSKQHAARLSLRKTGSTEAAEAVMLQILERQRKR